MTIQPGIIPSFNDFSDVTLGALAEISELYEMEEGQSLFYQGDMATAFYAIYEGAIRLVEHTTDGRAVTLKVYGAGDIFGLLAISGSYPYPASAEAMKNSLVLRIPGKAARELMLDHPELAVWCIDMLVSHVHVAHGRIRQMAAERVERRLARALLQYCEKFGNSGRNAEICIDIPLSQQAIAEFIGTTVETINRTLKSWESVGYIRRSRMHLDVLDEAALIQIAEDQVVKV